MWLRTLVVALGSSLAGGLLGLMLLSEVTFLLTWIFFRDALNSGRYLQSMDGTSALGFVLGAVTGLAFSREMLSSLIAPEGTERKFTA